MLVAGVPAKEIGRVNEMGNIIDLDYKKDLRVDRVGNIKRRGILYRNLIMDILKR